MTPDSFINKRLVALFLLGCLLFNYPILSVFNAPALVLGFPLLYLYLFVVWAALITLAVLSTQAGRRDPTRERR